MSRTCSRIKEKVNKDSHFVMNTCVHVRTVWFTSGGNSSKNSGKYVRTSKSVLRKVTSLCTEANSQYRAIAGAPPWRLHRWLQLK